MEKYASVICKYSFLFDLTPLPREIHKQREIFTSTDLIRETQILLNQTLRLLNLD